MNKTVYLDNATVAKPSSEAVSKMLPFYSDKWGSFSQPHQKGLELSFDIATSLKSLYQLLGANENDTIIVTSSGAEAINHAILSTYHDITLTQGKNHFITLSIDEAPMIMSLNRLEKLGCSATYLKPDSQGVIPIQSIIEAMTPRTALVSLSWANGLTGVIQPISEIAKLCQLRGVRLLVDATHVLGKLFFDIKDYPIDFLAFNGEQLHAPKGTGGLYIKEKVRLSPLIVGGIEQDGLRAGSLNVPTVVALGLVAKQTLDARDFMCTEVARLKYHFEKSLLKSIPQAKILFESSERVPHITAIAFPHVINEALLFLLHRKGVFASIGGGSQQQINHVILAAGISQKYAASALSFALSRETSEDDIDRAVFAIETAYKKLSKASSELTKDIPC